MVTMITPVAIDTIGYQYYIVFTVIGACVLLSVYWFFPETQGRTLEEMDTLFREKGSMRGVVKASLRKDDEVERKENDDDVVNEEKRRVSVEEVEDV